MNGAHVMRSPQEHADRLAEALRMALLIADEACRTDIESWGRGLDDRWYDISPHANDDDYERAALIRAAKYLTLRDQLEVDRTDPQRVRVRA